MAQEEAQEQARKCKQQGMVVPITMGLSKCDEFNIITDDMEKDKDKTPSSFITIQFQTYTFIDSRADGNTISYELFQKLKDVKLIETNAVF